MSQITILAKFLAHHIFVKLKLREQLAGSPTEK